MGVEASYQAIPEDCELLAHARSDRAIGRLMEDFNRAAQGIFPSTTNPTYLEFIAAARQLALEYPGLIERSFRPVSRDFDKIVYLLSPERRVGNRKNDHSLIHQAVYGSERLHPDAFADGEAGHPIIGFVPARDVSVIADYLAAITYDMLHEHYHPEHMLEMHVYKMSPDPEDAYFHWIWEEFEGMRRVYQQAAAHGEAMITVID